MSEPRLRVAVIGTGRWGKNLVRVFGSLEQAELVSVCDVDTERLGALDTGASKVSDVARVLSDRRVDAVVIATPPGTHTELAVASFEAGKHVFVEKPMALSVADARRVVRAAQSANRRGMVGYVLHHHPAVHILRQWMDGGVLGQIVRVVTSRRGTPGGMQESDPWWSLGPHDVSMACFLLRRDPRSIALSHRADDATTTVDARLEFADGCAAKISVTTGAVAKVRRMTVVGTRATAVFDDTRAHDKLILLGDPVDTKRALAPAASELAGAHPGAARLPLVEPLRLEAAHFAAALLGGTPFSSDVVHGARVVEVLEAGQTSLAQEGRSVSLRGAGDGHAERLEDRVSVAGRVQMANRIAAV